MPSADGKGRTLWDILTGRNQRDMTPLELQYHNPLSAKIGCTVTFDHEPDIIGINFVIEKISVFETRIRGKKFYHTDYHLRGTSLDTEGYVRMRLRVIPDENAENEIGCFIRLLYLYKEMAWDEGLYQLLCANGDHDPQWDEANEVTFKVNYDDDDNELEEPRRYWRIEDVPDPFKSRVTLLHDADKSGTVDDDELEHYNVECWDFARNTQRADNDQPFTEFLCAEMDSESRYFTFLRGADIQPFQITVY